MEFLGPFLGVVRALKPLRTGSLSIAPCRSKSRKFESKVIWVIQCFSRDRHSTKVTHCNIFLQIHIYFSPQAVRFAVHNSSMVAGLMCASPLCSILLMGKLEPAYQPKSGAWFQRMHQLPLLSRSRTWARSWTSCGVMSGALCDLRDQNRLVRVAGF